MPNGPFDSVRDLLDKFITDRVAMNPGEFLSAIVDKKGEISVL